MSSPEPPPYGYATPTPPTHGSATTAMSLGLIGLIGILTCAGVTLLLSPFAWAIGSKTVREIDADPDSYSGREMAVAGKVMGIIGTVLLVLAVLVFVAFVVFFVWIVNQDSSSF